MKSTIFSLISAWTVDYFNYFAGKKTLDRGGQKAVEFVVKVECCTYLRYGTCKHFSSVFKKSYILTNEFVYNTSKVWSYQLNFTGSEQRKI